MTISNSGYYMFLDILKLIFVNDKPPFELYFV